MVWVHKYLSIAVSITIKVQNMIKSVAGFSINNFFENLHKYWHSFFNCFINQSVTAHDYITGVKF